MLPWCSNVWKRTYATGIHPHTVAASNRGRLPLYDWLSRLTSTHGKGHWNQYDSDDIYQWYQVFEKVGHILPNE